MNAPLPRRDSLISRPMALIPLDADETSELLVTGVASKAQYATYWGRTNRERYNTMLESSIVSILGMIFSYFMSFVLGGFVATLFGSLFLFWGVLSPELKSRQRNWELLGGREIVDPWSIDEFEPEDKQGLYASLYLGRVEDVCVVESTTTDEELDLVDFEDYTMEDDELEKFEGTPYLLRLRLSDDEERELQVHARMSEEYIDIQPMMPVVTILLSKSQKFSKLAALTDIMIPDAECWVGDYPYLNRPEVERFLADDDEVWDTLQDQRYSSKDDYKYKRGSRYLPPSNKRRDT